MKKIPLTRGLFALVDSSDFQRASKHEWHAVQTAPGIFYAARTVHINGRKKMILMHRELTDCPEDLDIDHWNRDRLDNRRKNLRPATRSQNLANKPTLKTWRGKLKTSPFRGVAWDRALKQWTAQISIANRKKHIGCFRDPAEAARAYDQAALKTHGAFATLNFPARRRD